jgi:hypothetical protein
VHFQNAPVMCTAEHRDLPRMVTASLIIARWALSGRLAVAKHAEQIYHHSAASTYSYC